jgi:hypothetical protein
VSKHKSKTTIRLTEIGNCIRKLGDRRRQYIKEVGDAERAYGLTLAITALGEYKKTVRESAKATEPEATS